jgi:amidase
MDRMRRLFVSIAFAIAVCCGACNVPTGTPTVALGSADGVWYRSVAELSEEMAAGRLTSERLVGIYLERIETLDHSGPLLLSVLAVNPRALDDARALDAERAGGNLRGPLHGIPVLLKDNIESADPLPTTAGSLALIQNYTDRDAPVVARLRAAGAVILGKANLSEWANIRSSQSSSGWSAVGGLVRNPHALDRNACGSSAGSGAAVAAGLATLAVGTETDGSVTCPSAINGIVGLKPTIGLVSRRHIVPISHTQDTAGPMTRTVTDAALMLGVMAGSDDGDPATAEADARKEDYTAGLDENALRGARIGVMRFAAGYLPALDDAFERALDALTASGAELVDIDDFPEFSTVSDNEFKVLMYELKSDMNAYLATAAAAVESRTLADLIAFNEREAEREMPFFGQELFLAAEATTDLDDPDYREALSTATRLAGPEGIDRLLGEHDLDALVAPTTGPAWQTDLVNGDHYLGAASTLPAVAGYPHLTVPMGQVLGLPVGLSFIGPAWSEARILALGYAFEQRTNAIRRPTFAPSIGDFPEVVNGRKPAATGR